MWRWITEHIARVLDAVTDSGKNDFVMELSEVASQMLRTLRFVRYSSPYTSEGSFTATSNRQRAVSTWL